MIGRVLALTCTLALMCCASSRAPDDVGRARSALHPSGTTPDILHQPEIEIDPGNATGLASDGASGLPGAPLVTWAEYSARLEAASSGRVVLRGVSQRVHLLSDQTDDDDPILVDVDVAQDAALAVDGDFVPMTAGVRARADSGASCWMVGVLSQCFAPIALGDGWQPPAMVDAPSSYTLGRGRRAVLGGVFVRSIAGGASPIQAHGVTLRGFDWWTPAAPAGATYPVLWTDGEAPIYVVESAFDGNPIATGTVMLANVHLRGPIDATAGGILILVGGVAESGVYGRGQLIVDGNVAMASGQLYFESLGRVGLVVLHGASNLFVDSGATVDVHATFYGAKRIAGDTTAAAVVDVAAAAHVTVTGLDSTAFPSGARFRLNSRTSVEPFDPTTRTYAPAIDCTFAHLGVAPPMGFGAGAIDPVSGASVTGR